MVRVSDEQKEFVDAHGGSEYIRKVIDDKMKQPDRTIEQIIEDAISKLLPTLNQQQPLATVKEELKSEVKFKMKGIVGWFFRPFGAYFLFSFEFYWNSSCNTREILCSVLHY